MLQNVNSSNYCQKLWGRWGRSDKLVRFRWLLLDPNARIIRHLDLKKKVGCASSRLVFRVHGNVMYIVN
jgi:hypothetical protein